MREISLRLLIFIGLAFSHASFAATASTSFQVNATVVSSCNVSAANLNFGNYDPVSALPTDGSTTVTVTCALSSVYSVGLDQGTGTGASVAVRKMSKSGALLNYSLYQDATRLVVWGNTPGTDTLAGVGTGLAIPLLVYGRIPASQNVAPGAYADTITVSVNF